jgi:dTDP-4-dehydrorhamnose reductase
MSNIVILGSGKLAQEFLLQSTKWAEISRRKNGIDFNKTNWYELLNNYKVIVNCIANTNTYTLNKEDHWRTNYVSVMNLVDWCNNNQKKIVHISTDYVYSNSDENATETDIPMPNKTWYTHTKLLGDSYVQARANNYLLIRTSFKPYPWPYENAITTQKGNFDYTNIIAQLIIKLIKKNAHGLYNVGTPSKTIYELALRTKPDVVSSSKKLNQFMPSNITMNLTKLQSFLASCLTQK